MKISAKKTSQKCDKMSRLIAKSVRHLEAYVPGEQPKAKNVVKLNTNENPYPPSPKCAAVLRKFDLDRLRRYPDPVFSELRAELAKLNGTVPERIFIGNGSDEVLSVMARVFVEDDGAIGSLDPSYSLYQTLAAIRNVRWIGCEVASSSLSSSSRKDGGVSTPPTIVNLNLQPQPLLQPPTIFLLTNPNAPTGTFIEPKQVAAFAKKFKGVVVVDEAYADFARDNCMSLATAAKNENVIVMRTFSKSYSLAGLRVGYCVGPIPLIEAMYKVKDSYNVDAVAQAVALAAAKDQKWMKANVAKVVRERKKLTDALAKRGWDVLPSESNFVFAKPPETGRVRAPRGPQSNQQPTTSNLQPAAKRYFDALRERNIFVRYFSAPKTADRLRITIGTPAQMQRLLSALDAIKI